MNYFNKAKILTACEDQLSMDVMVGQLRQLFVSIFFQGSLPQQKAERQQDEQDLGTICTNCEELTIFVSDGPQQHPMCLSGRCIESAIREQGACFLTMNSIEELISG